MKFLSICLATAEVIYIGFNPAPKGLFNTNHAQGYGIPEHLSWLGHAQEGESCLS